MPAQLHNEGESLILTAALGSRSMDVGLYNDATDSLGDSAVYADITTEPSGSAYAVQTVSGSTVSLDGSNDGQAVLADVVFDTSDSSATVDACYVRDTSNGDLIFTAALDQSYDLSSVDNLSLQDTTLTLD